MSEIVAEFIAQIVNLQVKKSASEDMIGKLGIEFVPTDETVLTLKKLYKPDTNVRVVVMEEE